MTVEPNIEKNMKNELMHINHRKGKKSVIEILFVLQLSLRLGITERFAKRRPTS
jgi:hypothetical protein